MLCSDTCQPPFLAYIEGCFNTTDGLLETFEGLCLTNMDGTLCYTATYNSLVPNFTTSWQQDATDNCFVEFSLFVNTTFTANCSDGCRASLRRFNDELGCCVNSVYNNSFVGQYLPFANGSLWSECGILSESPGFCGSAGVVSAVSVCIFYLVALVTLEVLVF